MTVLHHPASAQRPARRCDGYAPIRDYAALGDGRRVALVARDGSIDWLCLPDLDSPAVFGALLDSERGGRFLLSPDVPFDVERRYLPGTNVLETTFRTEGGVAKVVDALTVPGAALSPERELARSVEGISGRVPFRWSVCPAFGYGLQRAAFGWRQGVPVATAGSNAVAVSSWDAGRPEVSAAGVAGAFEASPGRAALIAVSSAHGEPLVLPSRQSVEDRIAGTVDVWKDWAARRRYEGPWEEAVVRSALALKLLVFAPSGAVAAAATTSLPEEVGGERNWDYRYCWLRDSAFTLNAFLQLGCTAEADAFFWWLMQASQLTHPRLQVLYALDGSARVGERTLPLDGYRGSRPVRVGNAAADQVQLDVYGDLLHTAWLYASGGRRIDRDVGRRLAGVADLVGRIWRLPDAGLWEVRSEPRHFTQSKMMCWVALDRAIQLAAGGHVPDAHVGRWRVERDAIRDFVETECWSDAKQTYVRSAGEEALDASLLLGVLFGYGGAPGARLDHTVDAVVAELGDGPFLYRYSGDDGLQGGEGAFLTCSFWLVEALALLGRGDEATERMDGLISLANDVGLYAEEVDAATGDFLGNFPQGLTHLGLVNAAVALSRAGAP